MATARVLGIRVNDPQRIQVALHGLREAFLVPQNADGFGQATFADNTILLSRVPKDLKSSSFLDLIGRLGGSSAMMQIRTKDELRPRKHGQPETVNLGPFRLRQYAAAIVLGTKTPDEANFNREQMLSDLPDHLKTSLLGQTEAEALFLRIIAQCHQLKSPETFGANTKAVADAIQKVLAHYKIEAPCSIAFGTAHEVIHVNRGLPAALITVDGLSQDIAYELSVELADTTIGRERLRRFAGTFAFCALDEAVAKTAKLPKGMALKSLAEDSVFVVGKGTQIL